MWKIILMILLLSSCTSHSLVGVGDNTGAGDKSSAKDITAFSVTEVLTGVNVAGTISDSNITVTVPAGTDVTALVPTIEFSTGASVNPESEVAQDFTFPAALYTVTAEDGSTKDYIVLVALEAASCGGGGDSEPTYAVGDTGPAGGLIFYAKGKPSGSPSWQYLEAAPSDLVNGPFGGPWSNINAPVGTFC